MSSPSPTEPVATPRPESLAIHLDLVGGLAGDMFVAAIVDALPELEPAVLAAVRTLQPQGAPPAEFGTTASGGLRARRFGLAAKPSRSSGASSGSAYRDLRREIEASALAEATRRHALAILALLGHAEAKVHGTAIDEVHFHELADWDSLLDVVAAGCIAGRLEGANWTASTLPLGGGAVRTAHGYLPVPAPATAALMIGYPWRADGIGGERVTPTGAAILRHLVPAERCGSAREAGRLLAVGTGAGARMLPGMSNIARALVFDMAEAATAEAIAIVEFDVDDMTGEEIAFAAERLRTVASVIDVSVGARSGKKGRPLADFRLLVAANDVDAAVTACFTETSTLGLRLREERRRLLARSESTVALPGGDLQVKVAQRPDGARTAKTAHDDATEAHGLAARRRVRAAGERRALGEEES
jgi:uncharacterized protein (TIGR00299 family) protein